MLVHREFKTCVNILHNYVSTNIKLKVYSNQMSTKTYIAIKPNTFFHNSNYRQRSQHCTPKNKKQNPTTTPCTPLSNNQLTRFYSNTSTSTFEFRNQSESPIKTLERKQLVGITNLGLMADK